MRCFALHRFDDRVVAVRLIGYDYAVMELIVDRDHDRNLFRHCVVVLVERCYRRSCETRQPASVVDRDILRISSDYLGDCDDAQFDLFGHLDYCCRLGVKVKIKACS